MRAKMQLQFSRITTMPNMTTHKASSAEYSKDAAFCQGFWEDGRNMAEAHNMIHYYHVHMICTISGQQQPKVRAWGATRERETLSPLTYSCLPSLYLASHSSCLFILSRSFLSFRSFHCALSLSVSLISVTLIIHTPLAPSRTLSQSLTISHTPLTTSLSTPPYQTPHMTSSSCIWPRILIFYDDQ